MSGLHEHLDQEKLRELRDVLGAEFSVLVTTFVADSNARLASMRRAIAADDAGKLREAAHSLKGACLNVGARPLADLCRELEVAAGAAPAVVQMRLDALTAELGRVAALLVETGG